jgi:hypothetical protein
MSKLADQMPDSMGDQVLIEFYRLTSIDLLDLSSADVRELLELLPAALLYLHARYDMAVVYKEDGDLQ